MNATTALNTLNTLAQEENKPCVTISLNTHRTHPENQQDPVALKNLLKEAEERLLQEHDKRAVAPLLERMAAAAAEIDHQHNLESLHIFLSNDVKEVVRTAWPVSGSQTHIGKAFALRPLIKALSNTEEYHILLLDQHGTHLYRALNESLVDEVKNGDFPFGENPAHAHSSKEASDAKHMDNQAREYFNKVDKALVKVYNATKTRALVLCPEDNYSRLMQVADKPELYYGFEPVNHKQAEPNELVKAAWPRVRSILEGRRQEAVEEVRAAVSQARVTTDPGQIFNAAQDGRGELLVVSDSYAQAARRVSDREIELLDNPSQEDTIEDVISPIAWHVASKGGRVVFVENDEIGDLGGVALKLRY